MFRYSLIAALTATMLICSVAVISNVAHADKDSDCKLVGKAHNDNTPSKKTFERMAYTASLCEIANCVDSEKCTNQDKVDWPRFKASPAYVDSENDEKKALEKWHKDGNGAAGLVGYEILGIKNGKY